MERSGKKLRIVLITITVLFVIVYSFAFIVSKYAPEKLYQFLFPYTNVEINADNEREVELKKGDHIILGKYYDTPIEWQYVFDENGPVFQSTYIIAFTPYDDSSSNWEESELCHYLNSNDCLNFDGYTKIDGDVFLLSKAQCGKLSSKELVKQPTIDAIKNCDTNFLFLRKYSWYWTSSGIDTNSLCVAAVNQKGTFYKSPATDSTMGLCPAIKLSSKTIHVLGGDGSISSPYVLTEVK